MGVKNFKRLLISIPKCIEFNSESKSNLILAWVWVHTQDPDPIYTFFEGKGISGKSLPIAKCLKKKFNLKLAFSKLAIDFLTYQIHKKLNTQTQTQHN